MSIRVSSRALRTSVAILAIVAAAATLSGCTALGGRAMSGDTITTGSINRNGDGNLAQPMPTLQGPNASQQVAAGPYIPPADIGGVAPMSAMPAVTPVNAPVVQQQDLPVLTSATSGSQPMPAQPNVAPIAVAPKAPMPVLSTPSSSPNLVAVPANAYVHVITSGESLYTIARRYDVTAQAIVQANGFTSPDKIYVGQKIIIPGSPEVLAAKAPNAQQTQVAAVAPAADDAPTAAPLVTPVTPPTTTAAIANPQLLESHAVPTPAQATPAAQPTQQAATQPSVSGAEKFRWPVSGRVITDFANSRGTGINIEAPEGATVRAAENGTVIYVGSGVEGYGNLILIRHSNGFVSAYAHLKDMSVSKGQNVSRGDSIGSAGMTGSVSRPQLHFELRKGATPVDPVPLLAS